MDGIAHEIPMHLEEAAAACDHFASERPVEGLQDSRKVLHLDDPVTPDQDPAAMRGVAGEADVQLHRVQTLSIPAVVDHGKHPGPVRRGAGRKGHHRPGREEGGRQEDEQQEPRWVMVVGRTLEHSDPRSVGGAGKHTCAHLGGATQAPLLPLSRVIDTPMGGH